MTGSFSMKIGSIFQFAMSKILLKKKTQGFSRCLARALHPPYPRWKRSTLNLPEISWTRNNFFSTWHVAGRIGNLSSFGSSLNKMAGGKTANMDRTCSHSCQVSSLKQSNQTHWKNRWKECSSNFYKLMAFWKPKHVIISFSSDHLWPSFLANSIGK